jgi:hypothetical protein
MSSHCEDLDRLDPGLPGQQFGCLGHVASGGPDRHSTELLLLYAAPLFSAEISPGFVWIVKLQRWLEIARLPWANVLYDGRRYLIRPSVEIVQSA